MGKLLGSYMTCEGKNGFLIDTWKSWTPHVFQLVITCCNRIPVWKKAEAGGT
jgi:hypothetical protein